MQTIVDFEAFSNKSIEHSKTKGAQSERTSASAHICHLYARTRFWTSVLHWKFWTEIVRTINRNINRKIQFIHRCILRNLIWADAIRRARTCIYIVLRLETLIRQSCANFHFNHRFNCTRRSSCSMLQQLQHTWRYRPEAVVPCAFDDEKTACFHLKKGFEKFAIELHVTQLQWKYWLLRAQMRSHGIQPDHSCRSATRCTFFLC